MNLIKKYWPLLIALIVFWIIVKINFNISITQNQGNIIYAIDDAYVHMAIAKNLAEHSVWGTTKYHFASSSSSLLWTLLIYINNIVIGITEKTPLVLNIIFSFLIIYFSFKIFKYFNFSSIFILIMLLSIIFFTPLPALVFSGMEHTLHILVSVLFIYVFYKVYSDENILRKNIINYNMKLLLILSPLLLMSRYEGIFLLFIACIFFLLNKKYTYAFLLGFTGLLPITIYGIISISKGWYFLPNSVFLKGKIPEISSFNDVINIYSTNAYQQVIKCPHILLLLLICVIFLFLEPVKTKEINKKLNIFPKIFIIMTLLHMQFAGIGWFHRYEAYLVTSGLMVIGILINNYFINNQIFFKDSINKYSVVLLIIFFLSFSFFYRGIKAIKEIPQATTNIYEQQYQMGLFIKKFYPGECVAVHDIGSVSYLSDSKILDLWGLGTIEVAKERRAKKYDKEKINYITKTNNTKIAIVYDYMFIPGQFGGIPSDKNGGLPDQWIQAGQWKIENNIVCGADIVTFYAVNKEEATRLIRNLEEFSPYLPKKILRRWRDDIKI